ncbi:MAG: Sua5/YciO/YrdC/YwlC family protein [Bacteriovoracaceae bacterium]|nr:Sua5/YciO/YrdC/YwlC family protein [Bacteriovoracaceae bacterium]
MNDLTFIYPTDTVWGIGGSIESELSAKTIQQVKKTLGNKPISVMFKSIDQLREYLELPPTITDEWLETFFSMESTLAVPLSFLKKRIGKWITADSDLIAVRQLPYPSIKSLIDRVGCPITTTSFNLTGSPPLTDISDVKRLVKSLDLNIDLVIDETAYLSGNSSSIVILTSSGEFSFLREGRLVNDVRRHCSILTA